MNYQELPISVELRKALAETFRNPADARRWLQSPVPALGGSVPAKLIQDGRSGEVVEVLAQLNMGFST